MSLSLKQLQEMVIPISSREVEQRYPEMEFVFIPPGSPHMGGAWERLVRSTKSILSVIFPSGGLRKEILRAALADVECTLNSRPLTYVPVESPESEALTPNHFFWAIPEDCVKEAPKLKAVLC
ncbi:hypothetical protein ACLKA6_016429 [Drosophila palustris]